MGRFLIIILGVAVLVAAAWYSSRFINVINTNVLKIPPTFTPAPSPQPTNVPPSGITPADNNEVNIRVLEPTPNSLVASPIVVRGEARVFENMVSLELKDSSGKILYSGTTYANAPDIGQYGPFKVNIEYVTNSSEGVLTVYQASARDGTRVDEVTIPLRLR